nr:MAG TPA: replisome organizer [Bacteriophage sp.]
MTRDETVKIIRIMCDCYPNYKPSNLSETVDVWNMMLEEYSYSQISMALKTYVCSDTSGFAPSIGQLINKLHEVQAPQELNEMEAWLLVGKALRNGTYGAVEEFNKLPPLVQKAVGSPDNLRNWAQTDSESIENVVQSNFMRTYRIVVNRAKEYQKMPKDIQALIENANRSSYSAQIGYENQQAIKLSLEDNKSQNKPIKGVPMPKEIKERIEQMKR